MAKKNMEEEEEEKKVEEEEEVAIDYYIKPTDCTIVIFIDFFSKL